MPIAFTMATQVSSMVNSYCMDGRDFVRLLCARPLHVESAADRSNKGPAEQQAGVQAHGHALHQVCMVSFGTGLSCGTAASLVGTSAGGGW